MFLFSRVYGDAVLHRDQTKNCAELIYALKSFIRLHFVHRVDVTTTTAIQLKLTFERKCALRV